VVAQPSTSPLWFEVLGPVRGRREGVDLDLGSAKQRAVLAVLLLHRNTAVPTARIVEAVWGDEQPVNGANVVQKYVAGLRRVLEPAREARAPGHLLALDAAGYTLAVGPDQLDLDAFERLRRSGLRHRDEGRPGQALRTLRDAVDVVGGEPLAGLTGDWFAAARARVVEEWTDTLEACVELEVALARHEQALPEIRGLVARFPLRERLRGALMLALYRSGRPAEALAAFQATREDLVEALGAEPGPALRDLHAQVLRSDPSLLADGDAPGAPRRLAVVGGTAAASDGPVVPSPGEPSLQPALPAPEPPPATTALTRPSTAQVTTPPAAPRRGPLASTMLAFGAAVLIAGTLGLAGVLVAVGIAASAGSGRRRPLWAAAALSGALFAAAVVLLGGYPEDSPPSIAGFALLVLQVVGTIGLTVYALFHRATSA
jgi:DNA-binding SARP family transcriptional activator